MKKIKKFLIYALLIATLWIFSNIVIYIALYGTQGLVNKINNTFKQVNQENMVNNKN